MPSCQPRWRRCRGGREIHPNALRVQEVENAVEPPEVVGARPGFQPCPREDGDRYQVDTCLLHGADIFQPDLLRPLVGVVVATIQEVWDPRAERLGGRVRQALVGRGEVLHGCLISSRMIRIARSVGV